ncbi:MAG: leucine-rich repeat protein [Kiritimatiellae bacterium]|nr:leucine-rich repeat protein [Kiritimatiellia bacterium]
MKSKLFASVLACLVTALSVRGEILMYEGFPTGEGGYPTTASTAINGLTVTPFGSVAFDASARYWAGNYVNSPGAYEGLSYPASFDSATYPSYAGAATLCATVGHAPTQMRQAIRQFSSNVFKDRTGKVYFRMLMQADETALGRLTGADGIVALNHYAAGLLYDRVRGGLQYATESLYSSLNSGTSRNAIYYLAFGFIKALDGSLSAALLVRGADDVRSVYPILTSVVPGETYICLAEIDLNAGTDGKEKVRAMIQPVSNYNPKFLYATLDTTDTIEVDIVNSSCYLDVLLAEEGLLHTNNGVVKFDEFGVATTADDLVYIQSATGSKTVMVAGNPSGIGAPDPDYGTVSDVEVGTTFSCGDDFFRDGVMHSCTGYTYETRDEQGAWSEPQFVAEKTYVLDDSADTVRITWQWAPVAYRVQITSYGSGTENFTFGADPVVPLQEGETGIGGYFAVEELTITAVDGGAPGVCEFKAWGGDIVSAERTLALSLAAPVALTATFQTHWRYVAEDATLTDGNWVLTTGAYAGTLDDEVNPLMITGSTAGSGVLDLSSLNDEISPYGPVRAIGPESFSKRADLVRLELDEKIVLIGDYAFQQSAIAGVPDFSRVKTFGRQAFQDCKAMKGNPKFDALEASGVNAFNGCSGLTGDLTLPKLATVPNYMFYRCGFDGVLSAPEATSVGGFTFAENKFTSASLPKLKVVSGNAFRACTKMRTLELAPDFTSIEAGGLINCSALAEVTPALFPDSIAKVDRISLQNAGLDGMDLVFPKGFDGLTVNAANESGAFDSTKIRSCDLSKAAITQLPKTLFRDCANLESVSLPATVDKIDDMAFGSQNPVSKLLVVDFAGDVPTTVSDDWANYPDGGNPRANRDWKMVIRVPAKVADSWMADSHFVPLAQIENVAENPNYDRIGEFKKVVGAWRNMWLSVTPSKGTVIFVR